MKKYWISALSFAAAATLLSSMFTPQMIAWYFEPPVEIGVNCRPAVEWGLEKFQLIQVLSLVCGAVVGLLVARAFRKKTEAPKL